MADDEQSESAEGQLVRYRRCGSLSRWSTAVPDIDSRAFASPVIRRQHLHDSLQRQLGARSIRWQSILKALQSDFKDAQADLFVGAISTNLTTRSAADWALKLVSLTIGSNAVVAR